MRIVCISDTHNQLSRIKIPDGDMLIHAGDLTMRGTIREVVRELRILADLPHRNKVLIAGNHDWLFACNSPLAKSLTSEFIYLENSLASVNGVKIYGSPIQPRFGDWAFNKSRGHDIAQYWDRIDPSTEILVTHGPPMGYGDTVGTGDLVGCSDLTQAIGRIKPKYHIFGHIHCGYGIYAGRGDCLYTTFINASCLNEKYEPENTPLIIDM